MRRKIREISGFGYTTMSKRKKPQPRAKSNGLRQWMDDVREQLPGDAQIVERSAGESKISAVFSEFLEPFRHYATNDAAYIKLVGLGVSAWNAGLLPEDAQFEFIHKILPTLFKDMTEAQRADMYSLIGAMVQRKTQFFADDRRYILSYHLEDTGKGYKLMMASTLYRAEHLEEPSE
ncbi:MAG: hypothetical protein FJ009_20785 [Chloroflexi bacterium]|nr:hypothetical protein [Chloroflexota bacterium]